MMEKIKGYPMLVKVVKALGFRLQALGILGVGRDDLDDLGIKKKRGIQKEGPDLDFIKKDYCCYYLLEF